MKKILNSLFCLSILLLMQNSVNAGVIDKTISNSGINKSSISVSVKDVKTGKTIYKLHDKKPSMPASTLKLITLAASVDTLGNDYKFSTKLTGKITPPFSFEFFILEYISSLLLKYEVLIYLLWLKELIRVEILGLLSSFFIPRVILTVSKLTP